MEKEIIALIAGGLSLFAYGLYIYQIWWGKTRPSRSSWWILTVIWTVVLLSSITLAPGETQIEQWVAVASRWLSISYIIGSLGVAISSVWRGSSEKWGIFDYLCAVSAGVTLVLYFVVKDAVTSLVFGILADLFGLMPTIKHAWTNPEEEDLSAWVLTVVACVLTLFAVSGWSISIEDASDWAIPVYLVIVDLIIVVLIVRRFLFSKRFT